MKMKWLVLFGTLLVFACTSTKKSNSIYWVSGIKTECSAGAGKMQCLNVHKDENLENPNWEYFYSNIEGFEFETGYLQKIEVKVEELDKANVPADASSLKYTLVKVLEKQKDTRLFLHDIWVAIRINGNPINRMTASPRMEINLSSMQVMGNNSCNDYSGRIEKITASEIKFGNIAATEKMCLKMEVADRFDQSLNNSVSYKREDLKLMFYDAQGNESLAFLKVD